MKHHSGQIEMICGCMFSGKTEELIRRVRRADIARQKIQVFKPALDNRYSVQHIASHNGQNVESHAIQQPGDILNLLRDETTVVAIDEIQFFDNRVIEIVEQLANQNIRVILAGLDMDFRGESFGPMPELLCRAEYVTKLEAICMECGEPAHFTQRLVDGKPARYDDPIILVGAQERYEARCRQHHIVLQPEMQHD